MHQHNEHFIATVSNGAYDIYDAANEKMGSVILVGHHVQIVNDVQGHLEHMLHGGDSGNMYEVFHGVCHSAYYKVVRAGTKLEVAGSEDMDDA